MVGVLFLSTRNLSGVSIPLFTGADKFIHFVFYALMVIIISWGYHKLLQLNLTKIAFAAYWSILFGGLIELIQHFLVQGRSGEWEDFLANIIGALFGSYIIFKKYLKRTTYN